MKTYHIFFSSSLEILQKTISSLMEKYNVIPIGSPFETDVPEKFLGERSKKICQAIFLERNPFENTY